MSPLSFKICCLYLVIIDILFSCVGIVPQGGETPGNWALVLRLRKTIDRLAILFWHSSSSDGNQWQTNTGSPCAATFKSGSTLERNTHQDYHHCFSPRGESKGRKLTVLYTDCIIRRTSWNAIYLYSTA